MTPPEMTQEKAIWIVDRRPERRAALVRLVQSRLPIVSGAPGDPIFDASGAAAPRAILLGLEGDFERELDFVHHATRRFRGCRFLLVAEPEDHADARRLFDTLQPALLAWPPDPATLAELLGDTPQRDTTVSLSRRRQRESVGERFARWFGEAESTALLRSVDPRLHSVPLLIRGEEGTGRALLARYLHANGETPHTAFVAIHAGSRARAADLLVELSQGEPTFGEATVFLADVDRLPEATQHHVADWIEFGLPHATGLQRVRWIASAGSARSGGARLLPDLARRLAGLVVPLAPLREEPNTIKRFVDATLNAWATLREQRAPTLPRETLEILLTHPWPGNRAELEAVLIRSLSHCDAPVMTPAELRFEGDPAQDANEHAPAPPSPARPSNPDAPERWPEVLGSAAREIRQPLHSIQTFTDLLAEHHGDREFRDRFSELVGGDVLRIGEVIGGLGNLAALLAPHVEEVDLAEILHQQVTTLTADPSAQRVSFTTEFDRDNPLVLADPVLLANAVGGLLRRAVAWLSESGELFLASHHHEATPERAARARVLLRFEAPQWQTGGEEQPAELERIEASFEFMAARAVVEALGGTFTMNPGPAREVLLVIDLPAPSDP